MVGVPHGMQNNPQFQPQPTTVHNVELIQGYFSSGEEEGLGYQYPISMKNQRGSYSKQGAYSQPVNKQGRSGYMNPYPAQRMQMYHPGLYQQESDPLMYG